MKNICEICCEDFSVSTKHNTFKCWKTEPHLICKTCCEKESERRKTNGFRNPNECILCKPFQEKVEFYTVNIENRVAIEIIDQNTPNIDNSIRFTIGALIVVIILSSITWNISVVVWRLCHGEDIEKQAIISPNPIEIMGGFVIFVFTAMITSPILLCLHECYNRL